MIFSAVWLMGLDCFMLGIQLYSFTVFSYFQYLSSCMHHSLLKVLTAYLLKKLAVLNVMRFGLLE